MLLQSRGHYLTGGYRERHYALLKQWATVQQETLYRVLGSRYIMYGEWLYAQHTVYYDALPHYFLEFDILDRTTGRYLDTVTRHQLLKNTPVCSVPVLKAGVFHRQEELLKLLGTSHYITKDHLLDLMEGLYIKVEENGEVIDRMKFVRASFLQTVDASETHWLERPIIPNRLSVPTESLFEVCHD